MAEAPEQLAHPILGTLSWLADSASWHTRVMRASGKWLDVVVEPGDADRIAFLSRAAELFTWAFAHERRMLAKALRAELRELYNDTWRQGNDPQLSAAELTAQLEWTLLSISDSDIVPVEFSYHAGTLFGEHTVAIEVDAELQFSDIDLRG